MKQLPYLFCVLMVLAGCKADEPNPLLVGNWLWEGSSGGISGQAIKPKTDERIVLRFSANQQFGLYRNDTLLYNGTFRLTKEHSIYSGKDELKIETEQVRTGLQQKINYIVVIEGVVSTLSAGQLSIGDNRYDGFGSSYSRVK